MKRIIVYGSEYGTTESYAKELSKRTGIKAVSYKAATVTALADCQTLVYLGGLYAGGILGLLQTVKRLPAQNSVNLILATVGLADTSNKVNTDAIAQSAQKQLSPTLFSRTKLFHLRGGIDYQQLKFIHRMMMKMMYAADKKRPPEKQTQESREMVATYGKKVCFVNFDALNPIEEALR